MIIRIETVAPFPNTDGAVVRVPADSLVTIVEASAPIPAGSLKSGQHYCFFADRSHSAEIAHVVMEG